jgi:hypothetical protein
MNSKTTRKKTTSLKLVEDRFLTKKFKNKNQHELGNWFEEIAPENEWMTGEFAFSGKFYNEEQSTYAFSVYVNYDCNTINVAELEASNVKDRQDLIDSSSSGKQIIVVFKITNLNDRMWRDADYFQETMHYTLIKYIDNKIWSMNRKKILK